MRVHTTQATGKRWKAIQGLGFVGMIGGLVLYFMAGTDVDLQRAGGVGAAGCAVAWLYGRAGAWWNHS